MSNLQMVEGSAMYHHCPVVLIVNTSWTNRWTMLTFCYWKKKRLFLMLQIGIEVLSGFHFLIVIKLCRYSLLAPSLSTWYWHFFCLCFRAS